MVSRTRRAPHQRTSFPRRRHSTTRFCSVSLQYTTRPTLVGAVVLSVLLLVYRRLEQAAVTGSSGGELRVLYHPCGADRPAETVQFVVDDGDTPGNGNDTVLWEATAESRPIVGSDVMTFETGNVPTGYSETVTLHAPEPGEEVLVYMTVPGGGSIVAGFPWASLEDAACSLRRVQPSPPPVASHNIGDDMRMVAGIIVAAGFAACFGDASGAVRSAAEATVAKPTFRFELTSEWLGTSLPDPTLFEATGHVAMSASRRSICPCPGC